MRQDDDRFFDDDEDNDLWDDELELNSYSTPYEPVQQEYPNDGYSTSDSGDFQPTSVHAEEPEVYYSDPVPTNMPDPEHLPKTPSESRRSGLFGRKDDDDDDDNDYYDSDADPEPEPVRKPKLPKLDPEDPDYWISEEESGLGEIITNTGKKWKWWIAAACAILVIAVGLWIYFFRPYIDDAVKYGYIMNMERRGSIIKTFEGTMIPYKELGDPDPFYFQKLHFSVESDSVAALMKRMMLRSIPVRVEYEVYRSPLPWKGEQGLIILRADSADPRHILPPEYRPK